jgi:HlyD family secretion protein
MSQAKIFPPEIIEFSVENYFAKQHSKSSIIYVVTIVIVFSFLALLPIIKVDISTQSRGIIRSGQENNQLVSAVYGEVKFTRLLENQWVNKGDTILAIKTDKLNEQIAVNQRKMEENKGFTDDLKGLVSNIDQIPKTNAYLKEYLAYKQEYLGQELEVKQLKKEFEIDQELFNKTVIARVDYEKKKNTYEMADSRLKLIHDQKINEWQSKLVQYELENMELQSQLNQLSKEKEQYIIIAPISGTINQYSGIKSGNYIVPNQNIAQISPAEDLIVECYVNPCDIGQIRKEMDVSFQFDAFNYNQWGTAKGKVIEIMDDIAQFNQSPVFKVRCQLQTEYLQLKNGYKGRLKKGMTLTSRFKLIRRSLFDLLYDKADDWLNPKILDT